MRKRRQAAIHQRHKREQILGAAAVWLRDVLLDRDENKEHEEEEFAILPTKGVDGGDGALSHRQAMRFPPPLRQQAISVCWSNGATVIVHKPAGVATQEVPALLNAQLGREAGAPVWLPHRIDKFTRGLQVVTLSKAACSALNRSSEQRRWRKEYRALACLPRVDGVECNIISIVIYISS